MILLKRLSFLPVAVFALLALISCDDEFNTVGADVVGGQLPSLPRYEAGVRAYSRKTGPVQTNGLSSNLLGVYNGPVYGRHVASVLTQVALSNPAPSFGADPVLDSVVVDIPYFSTTLAPDEQGNAVYRLDSIFGDGAFKLSVRRSDFFLNEFDPNANFEDRQKYYSDQGSVFENFLIGDPLYVNEAFEPTAEEVVFFQRGDDEEMDTIRVAPRLRIKLPVQFFQEKIINRQGSVELSNNNFFRNYFRGLYFKAEAVGENGSMVLMDLKSSNAGITLYYTSAVENDSDEEERVPASYKLNFGQATVNTYSQELPPSVKNAIEGQSPQFGAENLYLRGGEGSMAVVELFEDELELQDLKERKWLINEANLTFYVDQDVVQDPNAEPERIYLYNLATNLPLIDFQADPTFNQEDPLNSRTTHSSRLQRGEDGEGVFYRIRITEHVKQLLNLNAENVRLGLVITQNINLTNNAALKQPVDGITRVPASSVISPRGTVLHGNLSPVEAKKLKFNIFYTKTTD